MSLCKFESDIKHMPQSAEAMYERFSDLRNLEVLKNKMKNADLSGKDIEGVPADKMEEVKKYIEDITFEQDKLTLASPVGNITLCIVERSPQCIKFASEGSPIPLYVWIQLLPEGEKASKMKVTVGAEVNMFMKGMVAKPLQQAANGLATLLAATAQETF